MYLGVGMRVCELGQNRPKMVCYHKNIKEKNVSFKNLKVEKVKT